jgi:AraC family transcriptional regulator
LRARSIAVGAPAFSKAALWRGFSALYHVARAGEGDGVVPTSVVSVPLLPQNAAAWRLSEGETHAGAIHPGRVFVTGSKRLVWSRWDDTACIHITVSREAIQEAATALNQPATGAFQDVPFVEDATLFHLAQTLKSEVLAERRNGELFGESIGAAIAMHLVQNYADADPRRRFADEPLTHADLRAVVEMIDTRLAESLTLGEMAAEVHMSPYHFLRSLKAATGLPPHRYIMQRRVERAQALISDGRLSLEQIAERTGFSNGSHLAAQFRRFTGSTPRAWRRISQLPG